MKQLNTENHKFVRSEDYNYNFDKNNGFFVRWGKTLEDDPDYAPVPEILDIEVTTICRGPGGNPCPMCYKNNNPDGTYMDFNTFKTIIDKMPYLTQIALGTDAQCESNPDIWKICEYVRESGIVPNVTVADISDSVADRIAQYMGAAAVSRYDPDLCYNSVKKLTDRGMDQVNIHHCIYEENKEEVMETLEDCIKDPRLKDMNALIFLSLKQKGRGIGLTPLSHRDFKDIVSKAYELNVPIGFDSCTAHKFTGVAEEIYDPEHYQVIQQQCEPCESSCFSSYISVDGRFFPCSFLEGEEGWEEGLDAVNHDFKDIWNHPATAEFRQRLLDNGRRCPVFNI